MLKVITMKRQHKRPNFEGNSPKDGLQHHFSSAQLSHLLKKQNKVLDRNERIRLFLMAIQESEKKKNHEKSV